MVLKPKGRVGTIETGKIMNINQMEESHEENSELQVFLQVLYLVYHF